MVDTVADTCETHRFAVGPTVENRVHAAGHRRLDRHIGGLQFAHVQVRLYHLLLLEIETFQVVSAMLQLRIGSGSKCEIVRSVVHGDERSVEADDDDRAHCHAFRVRLQKVGGMGDCGGTRRCERTLEFLTWRSPRPRLTQLTPPRLQWPPAIVSTRRVAIIVLLYSPLTERKW